jgi:hypothetical protein
MDPSARPPATCRGAPLEASGPPRSQSAGSTPRLRTDVTVRHRPWGLNPHGRHDPAERSSVDAARATAGVRDEDDEPGDDRQADHDPDPYLPGPTTAPLDAARVIHPDLLRLVFALRSYPFHNGWTLARLPVWRVMNVTRCEASHGGTGGESPPLGSARAMFDGRQGLSAKSSPRAGASPTPRPLAGSTSGRGRRVRPARGIQARQRSGGRVACSRRGARRSRQGGAPSNALDVSWAPRSTDGGRGVNGRALC